MVLMENRIFRTLNKTIEPNGEKIEEKDIKNKIKINPPMGMAEAFAEIGAEVVEVYEIDEKIDLKKADMGEVIKDFRKSDNCNSKVRPKRRTSDEHLAKAKQSVKKVV